MRRSLASRVVMYPCCRAARSTTRSTESHVRKRIYAPFMPML